MNTVLKILTTQLTTASSQTVMTICLGDLNQPLSREESARWEKKRDEIDRQEQIRIQAKCEKVGYTSLQEKDWQVTFESLDIIPQNAEQIGRLKNWNPSMKKGVVLYGSVGTGKSTLCKAIINQFASKDYRCLFISVADAMQRLKDAIDKDGTSVGHETDRLIEPHLLLLDDLGAEKSTEWATEKIFVIFERRAAEGKHTFFTTNLTAKEISSIYKERIADRLTEFCSWIHFPGESFRRRSFKNEI